MPVSRHVASPMNGVLLATLWYLCCPTRHVFVHAYAVAHNTCLTTWVSMHTPHTTWHHCRYVPPWLEPIGEYIFRSGAPVLTWHINDLLPTPTTPITMSIVCDHCMLTWCDFDVGRQCHHLIIHDAYAVAHNTCLTTWVSMHTPHTHHMTPLPICATVAKTHRWVYIS